MEPGEEATSRADIERIVARHLGSHGASKIIDAQVDSGSEQDESAACAPGTSAVAAPAFRRAAGTWKIWEGTWFYATKTPGYTDVKVILNIQFRNFSTGMGATTMSKTLSPHHYGEKWVEPATTLLLLKSWCAWRARHGAWRQQTECRQREVARQVERLTAEIAHAQSSLPARPLLGSLAAEKLLCKWLPECLVSAA